MMNRNSAHHGLNYTPSVNGVTDSSQLGNMLPLLRNHSSSSPMGVSTELLQRVPLNFLVAPRARIDTNVMMPGLPPLTTPAALPQAALNMDLSVLQRALQATNPYNVMPRHQFGPPFSHSTNVMMPPSDHQQFFNPTTQANGQLMQQLLVAATTDYQRSLIALEQQTYDRARRILLMQQLITYLHDQQGGSIAANRRPVLNNELVTSSSSVTPCTLISSPDQVLSTNSNSSQIRDNVTNTTTNSRRIVSSASTSTSTDTATSVSSTHNSTTTSSNSSNAPASVTVTSSLVEPHPQSLNDTLNHFNNMKKLSNKGSKSQDRPRHPLNAYNFFFSDERRKILKEDLSEESRSDDGSDSEDDGNDKKDDTVSEEEFKRKKLLKHIERRREAKAKRRKKHDKTHGKIGFRELAKKIGKRWKELPAEKVRYYQTLADQDLQKYKKAMIVFQKKKQQEADEK